MFDKESNYEGGRGFYGDGLMIGFGHTSHLLIYVFPLCSVAPLSPPRTEHSGKDEVRIAVKELWLIEEDFRDLNQRLQKMGYRLIRSRYGWYWMKRV